MKPYNFRPFEIQINLDSRNFKFDINFQENLGKYLLTTNLCLLYLQKNRENEVLFIFNFKFSIIFYHMIYDERSQSRNLRNPHVNDPSRILFQEIEEIVILLTNIIGYFYICLLWTLFINGIFIYFLFLCCSGISVLSGSK